MRYENPQINWPEVVAYTGLEGGLRLEEDAMSALNNLRVDIAIAVGAAGYALMSESVVNNGVSSKVIMDFDRNHLPAADPKIYPRSITIIISATYYKPKWPNFSLPGKWNLSYRVLTPTMVG